LNYDLKVLPFLLNLAFSSIVREAENNYFYMTLQTIFSEYLQCTLIEQLQTRHLNREPFAKEIEEAFNKEWAIVQEENAEKKRLRAAAKANSRGNETNKDLANRLDFLEAFVRKWEPQFELWKTMQSEVKELEFTECNKENSAPKKQLAIEQAVDEEEGMKASEEDNSTDSIDEEDCTENTKSEDEEDTGSDEKKSESEDIEDTSGSVHPINVVEDEDVTEEMDLTKQKPMNALTSLPKATLKPQVSATSTPVAKKAAVDGGQHLKKGKFHPPLQGKGINREVIEDLRLMSRHEPISIDISIHITSTSQHYPPRIMSFLTFFLFLQSQVRASNRGK